MTDAGTEREGLTESLMDDLKAEDELPPLRTAAKWALRQGRTEIARPSLERLATLRPHDPGVLFLRRWAALLDFSWPVTRVETMPRQRRQPVPEAIDLVLFHADLGRSAEHLCAYMALAKLSFEAAARRAPRARRIFLTDERTELPPSLGAHQIIRAPMDTHRLMYERMRVQENYLASRQTGRASVLMDVDTVVNRDPATIFASDFDVGLTWRPELPDSPFNGGVIFVGPGEKGAEVFREARRCYDALCVDRTLTSLIQDDLRLWWGDQYAFAALVGYREFTRRQSEAMEVAGAKIQFFPCGEYNFTPEADQGYQGDFLSSRYFLHFKGPRKPMQAVYLEHMRNNRL